jgi:plastocyanin
MRFLCASLALGIGFLVLVPEPAHAGQRRGGPVRYGYAPVYSGPCQPAYPTYAPAAGYSYSAPGGYYYTPQGYSAPRGYAAQHPTPHQSYYPPPTASGQSITTATVTLADNRFEPATITVAPGTTVRWVNYGSHKHTVTSATGAWDSGDLAPGQVYSATFTKAGTYEYFCRHHKDMRGSIVVK